MERTNKLNDEDLIAPDYNGHPEDDDPIEEIDESIEDKRIEELLKNEQESDIKKMDAPFTPAGFASFGNSGNSGASNSGTAPWAQNNNKQNQQNSWNSWGSGSNRGNSSSPWSQNQSPVNQQKQDLTINPRLKRVVVCDALDCLVESYDSNGKPGLLPRALFDLKPKFDMWDKIASFNPQRVYIIFPSSRLVPGLGEKKAAEITLEYIVHCVATYMRIPRRDCSILMQMDQATPKDRILSSVVREWPNKEEIVYVGVRSGRWGLSDQDKLAAHIVGIDYIDMFSLLEGYYQYE